MNKVSIIIPVYNVEKYLKKCLDSVLNQTYKNLEIICINDGSSDNSLQILNEYAKRDKRFKVISQQNSGVSSARNSGIKETTGDYIAFLDSDDWYDKELIEKAVNAITKENGDIVIFGYNNCSDGEITPDNKYFEHLLRAKNEGCKVSDMYQFVNVIWNKLIKRDFIINNNILFPLNLHPTEDVLFSIECVYYNPKLVFLCENLYNYCNEREDSSMKKTSFLVENQINAFKIMLNCDFYKKSDINFKRFCYSKITGGIIYFYSQNLKQKFNMNDFLRVRNFIKFAEQNIPEEILKDTEQSDYLKKLVAIDTSGWKKCL